MRESVRVTLPSHEDAEVSTVLPSSTAAEENPDLFNRLRIGAVSVMGGLSLFAALESAPSQSAVGPPGLRAAKPFAPERAPVIKLGEPKTAAVLDDSVEQVDFAGAYSEMLKIRETGANAVKITAAWVTGQTAPSEKDMTAFKNAEEAANQLGLKVIINVAPCTHLEKECRKNNPPLTQWERGKFANWLATLAYNLTDVQDFVIGNENNYGAFWWPQHYGDGSYAAAEGYFKLLATSYDVLKKAAAKREGGKDITVYGLSLASKGSYPPLKFLEKFHEAYLKSGRQKPVLDIVSYHPYPSNSAEMPSKEHKNWLVGIADYPKLVAGLKKAFAGTPQADKELLISYDEYGIQTKIPPSKRRLYTGIEPQHTHAVSEAQHGRNLTEALKLSACQPKIVSFVQFLDTDEKNEARWQSGLRYVDGTKKSSFYKVRKAFENFERGDLKCD